MLGALVAGNDAGLLYNTWPLIDGALVPSAERLTFLTPAWRNLFENELTVQFVHRMIAYALWTAVILHAIDAMRSRWARPAIALAARRHPSGQHRHRDAAGADADRAWRCCIRPWRW